MMKEIWVIWTDCKYKKVVCACATREGAIKEIRRIARTEAFAAFVKAKVGVDPREFDAVGQEAAEDFESGKAYLGFWCDAACFIEAGLVPFDGGLGL